MKTVSRVLNNEQRVTEATRQRVWQAINELNYTPNYFAQQFARGVSLIVGLVLYDTVWAYQSDIIISSILAARQRGYGILTYHCDVRVPQERTLLLQMATQRRVDGFILTPPCDNSIELLEDLAKAEVPFVRVEPQHRELPWSYVGPTDDLGAKEMTEYLISLGHRRIGVVLGPFNHKGTEDRLEGYRQALEAHRIPFDPSLIVRGDWTYHSGLEAGKKLLSIPNRPTAIFAQNDDMAAGVLNQARRMGIALPQELSVAGFDDVPLAEQTFPTLTTVRQPIHDIATMAVNMLLDRIKDKTLPYCWHQLPTNLIIRESTTLCPEIVNHPRTTIQESKLAK
jgi:LacI family transcriptional regulator